jgi:hypothetical protein
METGRSLKMFGKRPRYDDTFGVRLDLGADRIDPLAARHNSRLAAGKVKPTVIVEHPRSIFEIFGTMRSRDQTFPGPKPQPRAAALPAASDRKSVSAEAPDFATFEKSIARVWAKASVQHRIIACVFTGWLLLATGLFVPALIIAVVYFALRNKAK